ncbi:MAG: hypothetical protein QM733_21460 [Ilumatobacteraceae bacterium]
MEPESSVRAARPSVGAPPRALLWCGAVVALTLIVVATWSPPGRAAAAGERGSINVIGDSLTVGTASFLPADLRDAGWSPVGYDAHGSRGIVTKVSADPRTGMAAVDYLRTTNGDSHVWIVALGTNDVGLWSSSEDVALIRQMLDAIGPGHLTLWVNVYLPASPSKQQRWNDALDQVAAERPTELVVDDWASYAASAHPPMASDHVHYLGTGYAMRAQQIADAAAALPMEATQVASSPVTVAADGEAGGYVAVGPTRALDTRRTTGAVTAGRTIVVPLAADVPAGSSAVAVNLTVADQRGAGYLTAYPCDRARPDTSSLNYDRGDPVSGFTLVRVDDSAQLCIFTFATTQVVVDVVGAFVPAQGLSMTAVGPTRIADTRADSATPLPAGTTTQVDTGVTDAAVMVNLTVDDPRAPGYLTAWACDDPKPGTSNLNYTPSQSPVPNAAIVTLGSSGKLCVFNSSATQVIVDLTATFTSGPGAQFQPANPTRVLDTRSGQGGWLGRMGSGQTITVPIAGSAGQTVVGTLTVADPAGTGFLTAWSGAGAAPGTSNLNYVNRVNRANLAVSEVGADGQFRLSMGGQGNAAVLYDVTGWFR